MNTATKDQRDAARAAALAAAAAQAVATHDARPAPRLQKLTIGSLAGQKSRPWVARGFGMRGTVTLFVGAGGASKTQFLLQCAFMFALGLTFAGFTPMRRLRTMLVSGEEDNNEMKLRLEAIAHWYITTQLKQPFNDTTVAALMKELDDHLWEYAPGEGELDVGPLVVMGDRDTPIQTPFCQQMKCDVVTAKVDIVIFDPLINFHEGLSESNPVHMHALNRAARQIGRAGDCNVVLAQHANKSLSGSADVDANAARGSSAQHAGARVQKGMVEMSAEEGEKYFRDPDAHLDYVMLGDPKQSYQRKRKHSLILRRVSVPLHTLLENNEQDYGYALEVADLTSLTDRVLEAAWLPDFLATIDSAQKSGKGYSSATTGPRGLKARELLETYGVPKSLQGRTLDVLVSKNRIMEVDETDGKHVRKVYRTVPQGVV